MTLKSKICKYLDYERKGKVKFSDLGIVFLYGLIGFVIVFIINIIITVGLIIPMIFFNYEPTFIIGSIETFPILYTLTSYIYGFISFVFVIIPLFTIIYFMYSKIVYPILSKIGNITILKCDLKEK